MRATEATRISSLLQCFLVSESHCNGTQATYLLMRGLMIALLTYWRLYLNRLGAYTNALTNNYPLSQVVRSWIFGSTLQSVSLALLFARPLQDRVSEPEDHLHVP